MIRHSATALLTAWIALGPAAAQQPPAAGEEMIRLPNPPAATAPASASVTYTQIQPATATGPLPEIGALTRDAVTSVAQTQNWNIGLRAEERLPRGRIMMGSSFPDPGILRLTGEEGDVALALSLPQIDVLPSSFRLVLRSSVNDLPERSSVAVSVNGQGAGTWPLSDIGDWGQIDVPGTALMAGVNQISLRLVQQH